MYLLEKCFKKWYLNNKYIDELCEAHSELNMYGFTYYLHLCFDALEVSNTDSDIEVSNKYLIYWVSNKDPKTSDPQTPLGILPVNQSIRPEIG